MAIDWKKINEKIDVKGLAEDVKEAAKNGGGGDFKEVPHGEYEVEVNKMELVLSKKGDPMVSIWFKVVAGEHKGSLIFYNQVVTRDFQVHFANELLRSMETGLEIEFVDYDQYANLIMDVGEAINGKLEFALKYDENNKGYNTFDITEVFEVD